MKALTFIMNFGCLLSICTNRKHGLDTDFDQWGHSTRITLLRQKIIFKMDRSIFQLEMKH